MLSSKVPLKKIRFEFSDLYNEIDKVEDIRIVFIVVPSLNYLMTFNKYVLTLAVKAVFIDAYIELEIIRYEGYVSAVFDAINKDNDKEDIKTWLKHITATVWGYWISNCPKAARSYKISLDIEKYSAEILDFLVKENLYK